MNPMTGPWRIVEKLDGGSYKLEHHLRPGRFDKKHASMLSPYPLELVPFEPIDGPDNRFSQIHKPIGKLPFIDAGIKGFNPIQPFAAPAAFADATPSESFHWLSVSELNDELFPFPWEEGEEERVLQEYSEDSSNIVMYNGPTPSPPIAPPSPVSMDISTLASAIVKSTDRLFFISHSIDSSPNREWRLARVALADSMSLHPRCLQDGRFLVELYILHPADLRFNAANQRYWLQYHSISNIVNPSDTSRTHLIRPTDTSEHYALSKKLAPLRLWVTLTHESTYIHGPFDFTTIRGRRSRDRISADDWKVLHSKRSMYDNNPPDLDLPTFSIHIDRGSHVSFHSASHCTDIRHINEQLRRANDRIFC
eukprot:scaffold37640_cov83-Cyclotella_meneghiniana.AAC.3